MFYYHKLEEVIFNFHEILSEEPDELIIISGFLGPSPVERLSKLPFKTKVIGGMYTRGIDARLIGALKNAQVSNPNLNILFSTIEVHSKIYIWRKNKKILSALIGSANFSSKGLRTDFRESLAHANRGTFDIMQKYLEEIEANAILEPLLLSNQKVIDYKKDKLKTIDELEVKSSSELPLYSLSGGQKKVQPRSGLNWGLSSGHVAKGDAYIAVPKNILSSNQELFKPFEVEYQNKSNNKKRASEPIELIWDDGVTMEASFEGKQKGPNGFDYPKQLASYSLKRPYLSDGTRISAKSILGRYLRNRLGVDIEHEITYDDLQKYGRDNIEIHLIEDGLYYCDFSIT